MTTEQSSGGEKYYTDKESLQPLEKATGSVASESVESGGVDLSDLEYSKGLSAAERKVAKKKLVCLHDDRAQQFLDELAACMLADSVRVSPLAYLGR